MRINRGCFIWGLTRVKKDVEVFKGTDYDCFDEELCGKRWQSRGLQSALLTNGNK